MPAFPIEEAIAIIARAAAAAESATVDDNALHLRVVRALDVFAAHQLPVAPERFVVRGAAPDDPARSSLDLMIAVLTDSDRCAAAVIGRAKEIALQVTGRAGDRQVRGAKLGIASGNGGDHQFFGTMVIEA